MPVKKAAAARGRSVRLPDRTWEMIDTLADYYGLARSQVIILAIDRMHERERDALGGAASNDPQTKPR